MTAPLASLTASWTSGSTVYNALKMNVTDTGHAAGSKLLDLQVGGTSYFSVDPVGALTIANGALTASDPVLNLSQTWNAGGVAFSAIVSNVTRTAFDPASKLIDLQIGGTTAFMVDSEGGVIINKLYGNYFTAPFVVKYQGTNAFSMTASGDMMPAGMLSLSGSASGMVSWGGYTALICSNTWGTLEQRSPSDYTKPNTYRIHNTWTDASNYERGVLDWTTTSNVFTVGTQAAGTGTLRGMALNGSLVDFQNSGTLVMRIAGTAIDIGNHSILGNASGIGFGGTGLSVKAAQVMAFGNGSPGDSSGWMQWGGQARVTGDVNFNNTTVLALITGLQVTLQAGRTYEIEVDLSFTCTAAQGIRAALVAAGGLTASNIIYDGWIMDSGANGVKGNAQATALGTVVANAPLTGAAGHLFIRGVITVGVGGTLQVHAAQSVAAANNTTVKQGSNVIAYDMP